MVEPNAGYAGRVDFKPRDGKAGGCEAESNITCGDGKQDKLKKENVTWVNE